MATRWRLATASCSKSSASAPANWLATPRHFAETARPPCSLSLTGSPPGSSVADPIKKSAREAIQVLQQNGIRVVMLTGDSRTNAEAVARKLGIDEIEAEVLPERKFEVIKRLQTQGH